ncbi:MAG: UbiD family decarboxylase [Candidatus Eisenbacteria bacterium]|uniref:UbiD family decarboxylase n=1 Tax=Eiseniibacteriota bacterium TaxID=2212470 RepID=A0A956NH73_UNCEI|nr:UbiD family decarboxylase [Candidatus Eisenbacteria bacterium]MCB9463392.1 UbiD family decarboxylase [Candidatus Eisenbacteria bacterium]
MAKYMNLGEFVEHLDRNGELARVTVPVSPRFEIAEVIDRVCNAYGPAVLFENVEGYEFPVVANLLGSERRIRLLLDRDPREMGELVAGAMEKLQPPKPKALWESRGFFARAMKARMKNVGNGPCQEVVREPELSRLPILTSWPLDGGPFITWPMALTQHPETGGRNLGTYRMHVFDDRTTGMHMQIQKGGGFHYGIAEAKGESLPMCVLIGGDPVLMLASIAPLPENVDELAFAAFLRGEPMPMVQAKSVPMRVPAIAEFVLEGRVPPKERRMEGPFGDHFGHYSHAHEFPVFHLEKITHRKGAIFPVSVVGQPPQEDRYIGDVLQDMMVPLAKMMHPEIQDLWAFYEAGFHNLLAISVRERYEKEAMKAAFGLLGTGQVSLSKIVVTVGPDVDCRRASEVFRAIGRHFLPEEDFTLLSKTALDTLDFTSYQMNLGSKMILDATPKARRAPRTPLDPSKLPDLRDLDSRIVRQFWYAESCLLVQVEGRTPGRKILERLLSDEVQSAASILSQVPVLAIVSEDVRLDDECHLVWGLLTRFDAARDVLFAESKLVGAAPVHRGTLGIDATWKEGYPEPVRCSDETKQLVDSKWASYGL